MAFLVSQFLVLFTGLVGLVVWASADMPLAWREIAMNTRRDPAQGSPYAMLKVLAICLRILAVLLWGIGIATVVAVAIAGPGLGGWGHGFVER
jgi:hypothetical protein